MSEGYSVTGAVTLYIDGIVYNFEKLKPAVDLANISGGKNISIVLNADVNETESVRIEEGVSIELTIDDHSVIGNVDGKLIANHGTLTINGDKGCVYNTDISKQGNDAVTNYGTLTVNGGWFGDKNNDMDDENQGINRGAAVRNLGDTVTLNGGHFTAGDNWVGKGGFAYALINGDGNVESTMYVNDGVYVYGANNGNVAVSSGTVYIDGGSFNMR